MNKIDGESLLVFLCNYTPMEADKKVSCVETLKSPGSIRMPRVNKYIYWPVNTLLTTEDLSDD